MLKAHPSKPYIFLSWPLSWLESALNAFVPIDRQIFETEESEELDHSH